MGQNDTAQEQQILINMLLALTSDAVLAMLFEVETGSRIRLGTDRLPASWNRIDNLSQFVNEIVRSMHADDLGDNIAKYGYLIAPAALLENNEVRRFDCRLRTGGTGTYAGSGTAGMEPAAVPAAGQTAYVWHEFKYFYLQSPGQKRYFYIVAYDIDRQKDQQYRAEEGLIRDKGADSLPGYAAGARRKDVYIRTFGYFEVFVNGRAVVFHNEKPKELLALLIDRRGGMVTAREAISVLWENEPATQVTMARYRKVAMRLMRTLEQYGIADIVKKVDRKRCIDLERVHCDLYDYLSGAPQHKTLFKGSYLLNYSWGEVTTAELAQRYVSADSILV